MFRLLPLTFAVVAAPALPMPAETFVVRSPDQRIEVRLETGDQLRLSAFLNGSEILRPGAIGLELDAEELPASGTGVTDQSRRSVDRWIEPVVRRKSARIREQYEELAASLGAGNSIQVRAFNDGFGYRFVANRSGLVNVVNETLELKFPEQSHVYFPEEEGFVSHNERHFTRRPLAELDEANLASLPVLVEVPDVGKLLLTDADLYDYPAMWVRGASNGLRAVFPPVPIEIAPNQEEGPDRNEVILQEADYIARTDGTRSFPWRAFIIGERDATFIESELVFLLSRELELTDPSWIKPGRVAWDWFNALNLFGVDFEAGINNRTYQHYIDFAAEYGLEYVILDEGWSISTTDVSRPNPDIDVPALVAYGQERGVDIILWSLWGPLDREMERLFELYQSWGVRGVKIDFMQRSDQKMVNFYTRVAKAAAERELLVSFHGSFKPAGLRRAWPNVITYEGVKGNEYNKWSDEVTAEHNVTIPFTRMAAGPMDYTPGAMVNAGPRDFRVSHFRPMTQGTRCHEIAKFVIYESALQMLCDSPSRYARERETTSFLARIPAVWDETRVLDAKIADYVVIARRSGEQWFLGAMTDGSAREFTVDLGSLGHGTFTAEIMRDGVNAENHAEDYAREERSIDAGQPITLKLAPNGGWAAILTPQPEA